MKIIRGPKAKKFGGKVFKRCGTSPSTNKKELTAWAKFQKRVNGNTVKIVKAPAIPSFEAYIRSDKKGK